MITLRQRSVRGAGHDEAGSVRDDDRLQLTFRAELAASGTGDGARCWPPLVVTGAFLVLEFAPSPVGELPPPADRSGAA